MMSDEATLNAALDRKDIENVHIHLQTISFTLPELSTRIFVRFYRTPNSSLVRYEQSHFIKTPAQLDAYHPSRLHGADLGDAVGQAIIGITSYAKTAVEKGHKPDEAWLVPNSSFVPNS